MVHCFLRWIKLLTLVLALRPQNILGLRLIEISKLFSYSITHFIRLLGKFSPELTASIRYTAQTEKSLHSPVQ